MNFKNLPLGEERENPRKKKTPNQSASQGKETPPGLLSVTHLLVSFSYHYVDTLCKHILFPIPQLFYIYSAMIQSIIFLFRPICIRAIFFF